MRFILNSICVIFIFATSHLSAFVDLEEAYLDDFILETKKIEIPGYIDTFNPSIVRWKNSLLMTFRAGDTHLASDDEWIVMSFRARDPQSGSTNDFGIVILDENFECVKSPQILDISYENESFMLRQQDPRLIAIGDKIYIVYSNMIQGQDTIETRRVFIAELSYDGNEFRVGEPECLLHFEGENEGRWQKNWAPFDYQGELYLSYSFSPHGVLKPIFGTSSCDTIATTQSDIDWEWGVLRGGTPALFEGDEYLGFFHSSILMPSAHSQGKKIQHYFMGAYTFQAHPPFAITRISPKPIVGKNFYHGQIHKTWKPLHVVFPGGFISSKKYIWVLYGRQDHETWVAKIDKKKLFQSLKKVAP